jgi:hypothetical protein
MLPALAGTSVAGVPYQYGGTLVSSKRRTFLSYGGWRFGLVLGQSEDRAWRRDSAEYMRSKRDQRCFGLGGERA